MGPFSFALYIIMLLSLLFGTIIESLAMDENIIFGKWTWILYVIKYYFTQDI
jgi:hypothetical protein